MSIKSITELKYGCAEQRQVAGSGGLHALEVRIRLKRKDGEPMGFEVGFGGNYARPLVLFILL